MERKPYLILLLAAALLLCSCSGSAAEPRHSAPWSDDGAALSAAGMSTKTQVTTPVIAGPEHSPLYLADCPVDKMLEYFEEVVLHIEYSDGAGDAALVQKWLSPICYRIYGAPTDEDIRILTVLFAQLNEIPGFPGIHAAQDEEAANMTICFLNAAEFSNAFSGILNGEEAYGATHFWYYTDTNEIYTADVGYRTDIDQGVRSSVLIEEIINTLGITDTVLRQDSIVYQYSDENMAPSDVDWVILKLLYDPQILCGMDLDSCSRVIRTLYY